MITNPSDIRAPGLERVAPPTTLTWDQPQRPSRQLGRWLAWLVACFLSALFIIPLIWMISTSLKSLESVFAPNWIPNPIVWQNYADATSVIPFGRLFFNTVQVTVLSTIGAVLSSSLVAYAFARLKWPGRDLWFGIVLATMMLPGIVTMIPVYILWAKLGFVNTFVPLIAPAYFGGGAFAIFLLRQFYRRIPMELSEAAKIDGASELRIWWQIIMPLAQPALATITIFAFNGAWQDYMGPLLYLHSEEMYTLQLGLTAFKASGGGIPAWNLMMAASLIVMVPVLLAFFLGQRFFVEGVTMTGLKG